MCVTGRCKVAHILCRSRAKGRKVCDVRLCVLMSCGRQSLQLLVDLRFRIIPVVMGMVSRRKSSRLAADAVPCRRCHVRKLGVHFAFGVIQVIMRVFRIRLAAKLRIHFSFCIIPVIMGMAGVRFPRNGAVHLLFGVIPVIMGMARSSKLSFMYRPKFVSIPSGEP